MDMQPPFTCPFATQGGGGCGMRVGSRSPQNMHLCFHAWHSSPCSAPGGCQPRTLSCRAVRTSDMSWGPAQREWPHHQQSLVSATAARCPHLHDQQQQMQQRPTAAPGSQIKPPMLPPHPFLTNSQLETHKYSNLHQDLT
eukprot:366341-Chlamydomonas_euryale.AAC.23